VGRVTCGLGCDGSCGRSAVDFVTCPGVETVILPSGVNTTYTSCSTTACAFFCVLRKACRLRSPVFDVVSLFLQAQRLFCRRCPQVHGQSFAKNRPPVIRFLFDQNISKLLPARDKSASKGSRNHFRGKFGGHGEIVCSVQKLSESGYKHYSV